MTEEIKNITEKEEEISSNFIHTFVTPDIAEGGKYTHVFLLSQTATST